jgi:RNA polymerase sigma factor (sigma-70 family)
VNKSASPEEVLVVFTPGADAMTSEVLNGVIRYLQRITSSSEIFDSTDDQLLEKYVSLKDEIAFEMLVRRHAFMVLGVCHRVLSNHADAEDAFQATFLVLVRKASTIRSRTTLSNWLYGVAYNTALKLKAMNAKRRLKEQMAGTLSKKEFSLERYQELQTLLDSQLSRLPEKYRSPIVLCDLEGKTIQEAARLLNWPQGTVATRLNRGRAKLAKQLTSQGVTLPSAVITGMLLESLASAQVPNELVVSTTKAASLMTTGQLTAIPNQVVDLTEGVIQTMFSTKFKIVTAMMLTASIFVVVQAGYSISNSVSEPQKESIVPQINQNLRFVHVLEEEKADAKEEKVKLPRGWAPVQVLVSLDKEGKKLVVKSATAWTVEWTFIVGGISEDIAPDAPQPKAKEPKAPPSEEGLFKTQIYDLEKVQVFDSKGQKIDVKELPKLLKEETVAMASLEGQRVDPLHFRVLKEGILTFVFPPSKRSSDSPDAIKP